MPSFIYFQFGSESPNEHETRVVAWNHNLA